LVRWTAFPGHRTRHLRLPRLWQLLAVVEAKAEGEAGR
jgi:hypothetical protein